MISLFGSSSSSLKLLSGEDGGERREEERSEGSKEMKADGDEKEKNKKGRAASGASVEGASVYIDLNSTNSQVIPLTQVFP